MADTRTYSDLQTRIRTELKRDGHTAEIKDAIASAVEFYQPERFHFNEEEATAAISTGSTSIALPTGLIEMDELQLQDGDNRYGEENGFNRFSWQELDIEELQTNSQPTAWTIYRDQIEFRPPSNKEYTLKASYHKRIELSASSTSTLSNAWTTVAEGMIRAKAKEEIFRHILRNEIMAARMERETQRQYDRLKDQADSKISTGRVCPRYF